MVLESIRPPSPCGPAAQADNIVRSASVECLLIQFVDIGAGFPTRPGLHGAQSSVTSSIALARNFEAVNNVRAWLLTQTGPDASS